MATVNLENVSKNHGTQKILQNLNLTIEKGEFVAIVGPSGSGKTTLIRLIAGLDELSEGAIQINNQCVNKIPAAQRDIAMVFQNYALYPHMTVFQNMAYGLKMRGFDKSTIKQRVGEVSSLLQLDDLLQRKPAALSGGQKQRVAMGRAIVRSPSVFLFDEPLSNLDAKLRTEMRHEIKKLHQQLKTTSVYITHDQTEAMTLADRIVILNKGRIEQEGAPHVLYNTPASLFVASFIGAYPTNFIAGTVDYSRNKILTELGLEVDLPPLEKGNYQKVILGVRPEHIDIKNIYSETLSGKVDFIDDMGADKLVEVNVKNKKILIRVIDEKIKQDDDIVFSLRLKKATIYCPETGKRLGGWS